MSNQHSEPCSPASSTPDPGHQTPDASWIFLAHDEGETEALGTALGKALAQGGVVALIGTLGAGKTRLVQSIAVGMGADRRLVSSPTFVLIQEYEAALPIFHCDTYRLRNVDEFIDLGIDEILHAQGVCLIEWADRVAEILPPDHLRIEIEIMGPTARSFRIQAGGPKSGAVLATARAAVEGRLQPSQRAGGFIPPGFLDDAIESEGGPPG